MHRHLQRKYSDTSCSSSEKESGGESRFYTIEERSWSNPCKKDFPLDYPLFRPEEAKSAPSQITKVSLLDKAARAAYANLRAIGVKNELLERELKEKDKDQFEKEAVVYNLKELHASKGSIPLTGDLAQALSSAHQRLMYFTLALDLIGCENILFPGSVPISFNNLTADSVEPFHTHIVCDLELTLAAMGKPLPEKSMENANNNFKMTYCGCQVARFMRQYMILRDYSKLTKEMQTMYEHYADKAKD